MVIRLHGYSMSLDHHCSQAIQTRVHVDAISPTVPRAGPIENILGQNSPRVRVNTIGNTATSRVGNTAAVNANTFDLYAKVLSGMKSLTRASS
jgi:hypothetical protein